MTELPATQERLEEQLDEGDFTRGVQMTVDVGGTTLFDIATGDAGTGQPMTREHVFRVYCSAKPVLAVALGRLVDYGQLDLDEPLAERLSDVRALEGRVTARHVLTHTAGLQRPMAIEMELVTASKRRAAIEATRRPPGWRVGVDAAYSEYAGWNVLGWLVEDLTATPLRHHLRRTVLEPLGLDSTWIGMTADEFRRVLPRLGVNTDLHRQQGFPLLIERTERVCCETNPAHGAYTNARDLARFYRAVLCGLGGGGDPSLPTPATLAEFCSPARALVYDQVLDRECSYGLGFMTDLSRHAFGDRCGETSFGHSGNVGASFGFADPERDLAVGVVFNGLVSPDAAFLRRRALINALYDDLDTRAGSRDAASPGDVPSHDAARAARTRSRFGRFRRN